MIAIERIIIFTLLATLIVGVWSCELEQARTGCKIQSGQCTCGFGCKSEYRYSSNAECRNALKERGSNICSRMPCLNRGTCIQVSLEPGFKCRCEGTGFYGLRCEKGCATVTGGVVPYECVVI